MVADVERACFHAKPKRFAYFKLPQGDMLPGEENMWVRLSCARRCSKFI